MTEPSPDPSGRPGPRRPPSWPGLWADGRWSIALTGAVVFLSRLPFLGPGYGLDPDAWRLARTGHAIATGAGYRMSRPPGYPLVEYGHALLWPWGPFAVNLASAALAALAALYFARVLHHLGSRDHVVAALALAFAPVVFINSTSAMDYVWALAFLMAALYYATTGATTRRALVAGLCVGLAIGCRITSGAMLLPLAVLLVDRWPPDRTALRRVGTMFLAAAVVGGLAFVPVVRVHGFGFLQFVDHGMPWWLIGWVAGPRAWGTLGLAAWGLALVGLLAGAAFFPRRERALAGPVEVRHPIAWGLAAALYAIAFLRLPAEPGYLIPILPFALLLLARYLHRWLFVALCALLVLAPFVDVGGRGPEPGPILKERFLRIAETVYVRRILDAPRRVPGERVVVVAGAHRPQVQVTQIRKGVTFAPRTVEFVKRLSESEFRDYRARGYGVYVVPDQAAANVRDRGFDLLRAGALPLF